MQSAKSFMREYELLEKPGAQTTQPAPCASDSAALCLDGGRFEVKVDWAKPSEGKSGHGVPVSIAGDTGYMWFFNSANVELVIKVLDGRPVNGHFWVFYGALSNVQYTITVLDTQTGAIKKYTNSFGDSCFGGGHVSFLSRARTVERGCPNPGGRMLAI